MHLLSGRSVGTARSQAHFTSLIDSDATSVTKGIFAAEIQNIRRMMMKLEASQNQTALTSLCLYGIIVNVSVISYSNS